MKKLDAEGLRQALQAAPGWELSGGKLEREWTFPDFVQAMKFVNHVAAMAEDADHHPDIDIRYNRVKLGLVTHSADGITAKDAKMAARISQEL